MSYGKIRHIQNVNLILERRYILKESKATDVLNAYPKGSVIGIKEFVKGFKDDVIGVVLSNMVDVFDKVKISGRRPSEGAAFYNFERKEIDINKNSPYWNEVDSDSIGAGLAHEFVHYLIHEHPDGNEMEMELQEIKDDLIDNGSELSGDKIFDYMISKNNSPQEIMTYAVSNPEIRGVLRKYKNKLNNISNELFGADVIR